MQTTQDALRDELKECKEELANRNVNTRYEDKRSLDSREGIPSSLSNQHIQMEGWLSLRDNTKKSRKPKVSTLNCLIFMGLCIFVIFATIFPNPSGDQGFHFSLFRFFFYD